MMALLHKKTYQKMSDDHSSKIARLLYRDVDVDEHINNISSYNLTFFDKLVLCCILQFSIPQPCISAIDIQASFEKAYWKLEPLLADGKKELAAATLRSIALNYIENSCEIDPTIEETRPHSNHQTKQVFDWLHPIVTSRKIIDNLRETELKPPIR